MSDTLETDFLVVGAGAMGLAFADEILSTTDRTVVLVDRRAGPGGHWNDAYDFVRLHQPATFYGVNSAPLGSGGGDLANKSEILAYFQRVVDRWSATGRLRFLAQCERGDDGVIRSLVGSGEWTVRARHPIVDATFSQVRVPATHPPGYAVSPDAALVPVGGLWHLRSRHPRYVVIGAGKTGYDALLYLLGRGVEPDRITWVVSRDAWLFSRDVLSPRRAAVEVLSQIRTTAVLDSPAEVFAALESGGWWLRVDPTREPTMFRCATVSTDELQALRRLKDVVRLGRVQRVEPDRLVLDGGERPVEAGTLFVDCTADGLARLPPTPVFTAERITLQPLFVCQQVMSAAAIAAIYTRLPDDDARNAQAVPVPHPNVPGDYIRCLARTFETMMGWTALPWLGWWMFTRRLSAASHMPWWSRLMTVATLKSWSGDAIDGLKRLADEA